MKNAIKPKNLKFDTQKVSIKLALFEGKEILLYNKKSQNG